MEEQRSSIFPTELPPRPAKTRLRKIKNIIANVGYLGRKEKRRPRYRHVDDEEPPQEPTANQVLADGVLETHPPKPLVKRMAGFLNPEQRQGPAQHHNKNRLRKSKTWKKPSPFIHGNISFMLVDNWTTPYRNGEERARLEISRWTTQTELRKGFQMHSYNRAKIVNGHLLLRTQTIIYRQAPPCDHRPSTICLADLFNEHRWSLNLCPHSALRSSKFKALLCPYSGEGHQTLRDSNLAKHTCAWTHKQPCPENCAPRLSLHKVISCTACYTDLCISVHRVGNSKWNAVMATTWKDLGTGRDEQDIFWQSHMTDERRLLRTGIHHGAFEAYEDDESSLQDGELWFPQMPQRSLRMFRNMKPA